MAREPRATTTRPADIEQGAEQVVQFPLYHPETGAELTVDGTVEVLDAGGEVVLGPTAIVAATPAELSLTGAEFTGAVLGLGWAVVWTLSAVADGYPLKVYRQRARLVRQRLYAVVSNATLLERHPELSALYPAGETSWDAAIESSWDSLNVRLLQTGKRPDMILSPEALSEAHTLLALSRVFRTCSTYTATSGRYVELADKYESQYELEWGRISLYLDRGDGQASESPVAAVPVLYTSGTPMRYRDRRLRRF